MADRATIIDKVNKLIAHEKSARTIGSIHEADAFFALIESLMKQHKITQDELVTNNGVILGRVISPNFIVMKGQWTCSCGWNFKLELIGDEFARNIANALLSNHIGKGHNLKKK